MDNTSLPNGEHVLLVEDDASFAGLLKTLLSGLGVETVHYPGAGPLVESGYLHQRLPVPPTLVVLDFHLQGLTGDKLCKALRKLYGEGETAIVFLSGDQSEATSAACFAAGADDFITKPIPIPQLKAKLESRLHQVHERRELENALAESRLRVHRAHSESERMAVLVGFMESLHQCQEFEQIAERLQAVMGQLGYNACGRLYGHKTVVDFQHGDVDWDAEVRILEVFRERGRFEEYNKRALFNFKKAILLIKDLPRLDGEDFARERDRLTVLLHSVEARISAVEIRKLAIGQNSRISATVNVLQMMMQDMEQNNVALSKEFEDIIQQLECGITNALMHFNLLEEEEGKIMELISGAIHRSSQVIENNQNQEARFRVIMDGLIRTLQ